MDNKWISSQRPNPFVVTIPNGRPPPVSHLVRAPILPLRFVEPHQPQERDEHDALLVIGVGVALITYPRCRPSLLVRAWGEANRESPA